MTGYPYPPTERFPESDLHRRYNMRPAVRSLRPLTE
jgi:hypothetical protein